MSVAPASSPYERFLSDSVREAAVSSMQRRFGRVVGSGEIEDAYGHVVEQLAKLTPTELDAIQNPSTWLFVSMRNRLTDRLRVQSTQDAHLADLFDNPDTLDEVLSDGDDVVTGSVIGRETAAERLAQVAELVWLKFTGDDGQIAARVLLEEAKPQAVAAELGLDAAYVYAVAHKAHQERRLLERKLKEDPEFRCWRLRKHTKNYYASGEVSLALRAHWVTCSKCRAAQRVVRDHTAAALNPLLPGAAVTAGAGGLLSRVLHHAAHPARTFRRLLRPAGHTGAQAGASSSQAATVGATVAGKAAVVATVAVVGTTAAGATTVAVVHHLTHHSKRPALIHTAPSTATTPAAVTSSSTPSAVTVDRQHVSANTSREVHRIVHHSPPRPRVAHKRRHEHTFSQDVVTTAATETQTVAAQQTATTASAPVASTQPATTTHSSAPTSQSSGGSVTNPSYSTPSAP